MDKVKVSKSNLKDRIIKEMTVDHSNALDRNFSLARQFIRITRDGKVDILVKDKISGKEKIKLYLIGKLYAKEAGYATTDDVGNKELMDEIGIPKGSVLPWVSSLKNKNQIREVRKGKYVHHCIPLNLVERTLSRIEQKIKKSV